MVQIHDHDIRMDLGKASINPIIIHSLLFRELFVEKIRMLSILSILNNFFAG